MKYHIKDEELDTLCTSTEEMMASLKSVNDGLARTGEDAVVISLDVKALYPSMEWEEIVIPYCDHYVTARGPPEKPG